MCSGDILQYSPYFRRNTVRHMHVHLIKKMLTILDLFIYLSWIRTQGTHEKMREQYNIRKNKEETKNKTHT